MTSWRTERTGTCCFWKTRQCLWSLSSKYANGAGATDEDRRKLACLKALGFDPLDPKVRDSTVVLFPSDDAVAVGDVRWGNDHGVVNDGGDAGGLDKDGDI